MHRKPIRITRFVGVEVFIIVSNFAMLIRYLHKNDLEIAGIVLGIALIVETGVNYLINRTKQ